MFSAHFFRSIYFSHAMVPSWAPKGGGDGDFLPPVEKLAGQVSPRNEDIL